MTTTTFVDRVTPIMASWLNDVDGATYRGTGTYTPSGGVSRTVANKFSEYVSVLDFGAVADGNTTTGAGTDNTAAFQAAINALGARGVLYVPSGVYRLASQIIIPSQFTMTGAGNYCSILLAATAFNDATGLVKLGGIGGAPTVIENLGILAQTGGAGAVSCGLNSAANGSIMRNLWVAGFKQNIIVAQSDNFVLGCQVEETVSGGTGITVTQTDVTIADCLLYHCYIGLAVSGVSYIDGTISISNCRSTACDYIGYLIANSSNVIMTGCGAGHNNIGRYVFAGVYIDTSTNVVVTGFIGRLGSGPSTTGIGISVTASSNILIGNAQLVAWAEGIKVNASTGVLITGSQCRDNLTYGIHAAAGDRIAITGNNCSDNGGAGVGDAGIFSDNSAVNSTHTLTGNICQQTSGGVQEYGIFAGVTDNGATSGITTLSGNVCKFNGTSDITVANKAQNIVMTGNVPAGATGGDARTVGVTAATYSVGYAEDTIVCNRAGTITLTLPAASVSMGRSITIINRQAQTAVSASANVVPQIGGAAATGILAATIGKYAVLKSDGASWLITAAN